MLLILLCVKSADKVGLSAGRAAQCHTHHHPSDLGRKEVDELFRFFRELFLLDAVL